MKPKTIIGLALIAVFTVFMMRSFGEQVGGYMDFDEASATQSRAHVVGQWVKTQPTTYDREANTFSFWMADENGTVREVKYANPKPANFEDAEQVVVEGQMAGDAFEADHILIKCPSKYNDERDFADPNAYPETTTPAQPTAL